MVELEEEKCDRKLIQILRLLPRSFTRVIIERKRII
jgi:hypothetical protein